MIFSNSYFFPLRFAILFICFLIFISIFCDVSKAFSLEDFLVDFHFC